MSKNCHRFISLLLAFLMTAACILTPLEGIALPVSAAEAAGSQPAETAGEDASASTGTEDDDEPEPSVTEEEEESAPPVTEGEEEAAPPVTEEEEESAPSVTEGEEESAPPVTEGEEESAPPVTEGEEEIGPAATEGEEGVVPPTETVREESASAISETETAPEALEPSYEGYGLIAGMAEHMASRPGTQYKGVGLPTSYYAYRDLSLFEGAEIDHINVVVSSVASGAEEYFITVSVVDASTGRAVKTCRFSPREGDVPAAGRMISLYPQEALAVAGGQTLGFGRTSDTLIWEFQNTGTVPESLAGFCINKVTANTTGGCLCVDVYAKAAPQESGEDKALREVLTGQKLSILGDSISTYASWSNSTAVNSTLGSNAVWYSGSNVLTTVDQTWWKQAADRYGMEILVNNSWSGSTVATYSNNAAASFGWNTRPDNLHDNTGDTVNPDIIAIYMGSNDLSFNIPCDPDALTAELYARIEAEDYAPAEVATLHEAAALMVHKVRRNYPNATICLFNSPTLKNGTTYRTAYNQVLEALAPRYDCVLVNLFDSDLSNHSVYTSDGVHPNVAGMDVITRVFADAMYLHINGCTEHHWMTVPGYPATFREPGLTDGVKCSRCGEVQTPQEVIPAVPYAPRMFRWEFNEEGSMLVSREADLLTDNVLTREEGSISGGVLTTVRLALADPLELRHDQPWSIEWRASGTWGANNILFSETAIGAVADNLYIFRPAGFVALGIYDGAFQNYAASLSGYNTAAEHTFRLQNRDNGDGTNMVYLYVDGREVGPLNQHYVATSLQNPAASDWVSGKDFRFRYIGTNGSHRVSGSGLKYLQVNEGIDHSVHTEQIIPGIPATGTEDGLTEGRYCSDCGQILQAQEVIPALDFEPRMFRWEVNAEGSALVSSGAALITDNALSKLRGSISNGTFSGVQLSLEEPVELRHNQPWTIEWRSSGPWARDSLLFSTENSGNASGNIFLYRHRDFISIGTYTGSYQNYSASLNAVYNSQNEYTFRLANRVNEDGSNMVYLYVDDQEIGALNSNNTSNWVSGRNFRFGYIGAPSFEVSGSGLKYLQVNEGKAHDTHTEVIIPGYAATETTDGLTEGKYCSDCGSTLVEQQVIPAEARVYRWEASDSALVSKSGEGFTANELTQTHGGITDGLFAGTQFTLAREIALRSDRAWSIEWRSSGSWNNGGMLLASGDTSESSGSQYLYHRAGSEFIALGSYDGVYKNYAAKVTGIDPAAEHTFRLQNRIAADGSNMVWLYVDGIEAGALNQYYEKDTARNTTSTWLSGKTLRFRCIGTAEYPVDGCALAYIQVNEGIPHDHQETVIPAVDATETQTGLTEGKYCAVCGDILVSQQAVPTLRETRLESALAGRTLSILGDGISTYAGISNSTGVNDTLGGNAVWYSSSNLPSANDTWWKQAADRYRMSILVNNAWSGATVTGSQASSGWDTRPGNLHDNTGTIVNPDIIAVYMGANDLTDGVACGTTGLDDTFFARIQAEGFVPAENTNFEESAALMVHRVRQNYPDAEIFLFNLPAMSDGAESGRAAYNSILDQLADHYGCTLVDLDGSGLGDHSLYTQDGIHPNAAGMDVMTEAFADALYERFVTGPDAPTAATTRGVYLSDLSCIDVSVGHGSYRKDLAPGGEKIQLRVDGAVNTFDKGIGAHATSTVTFNVSRYHKEYPRFIAKLGVDASQKSAGNVIFRIYGTNIYTQSGDFTGWTELLSTPALTAASAAVAVDLDVSGYSYLRLYADSNGAAGNDHSVYADARLVTADYSVDSEYFSRLHNLNWYDEQLSQHDYAYNLEHNQELILHRELVRRLGITTIQHSVKNSPTMEATLTWLLDDPHALQLFIEAGNILNAANTLTNLDLLYNRYQGILGDSGDGYVYKKMILALAVTWANDVARTPYSFGGAVRYFDIEERFEAARWVYDQGYKHYSKSLYITYNMELMRALMCDYLSQDEAQWVQHYAEKKYPGSPVYWTGPYRFMGYVHPPYYAREEYFSPDTWTEYDEKYDLTDYSILRSESTAKVYRLWMVYEAGGICWNISRLGQALNKSFGIPSLGTFQPGHEAYLTYSEDENGQGLWSLGNNVGGWQSAYNNWGGTVYRLLLNWGSGTDYSQKTRNSTSYVLLAQGALNRHADFRKSSYLNMLADSYEDNDQKLAIYRASLKALDLNLDTYLDIISLYKSMGEEITAEQWRDLAMEIIDVYTYYPVPMVDLVDAIEGYCGNYGTNVVQAKQAALNRARVATSAESLQASACVALANSMLGKTADDVLATFSFNGEHAGCIVLGSSYQDYAFQIQYSLDGGETWHAYTKEVEDGLIIQLTPEQVASITAENDIKMYISGMNVEGEDPNYFIIDILDGAAPVVNHANAAAQISIHDGENWIMGKTDALEYSLDQGHTWTAYDHEATRFEGDQTIQVRYAPHGTSLLGPAATLTFSGENERDTFRHISVSDVTLVRDNDTTYYEGRKGDLALDANPFTNWHSADNQLAENKQIVVSFDRPRQLSGITYKSAGRNGRFLGVDIYVSMDDTTWTWVGSASGWPSDDTMKTVVLENSVPAKYVRLTATTTNGFVAAQDIDFFEDTTKTVSTVNIVYSTTAPTQGNVTATLMLTDGYTAVGSSSYEFTDNGSHTFRYQDADGWEFSLEAHVDWIDRDAPTAEVTYSTTAATTDPVTATLVPSEDITVTNNGGELFHTFTANGSFTFEISDAAGNTASITATVDWIRPVSSAAAFSFDGENAGKLVLDAFYAKRAVNVTYSLDGGATSQTVSLAANADKIIQLTPQQLAGLSNSTEGELVITVTVPAEPNAGGSAIIDLLPGPAKPVTGYDNAGTQIAVHDGENWIMGRIANLEYSYDGINWTAYEAEQRFEGVHNLRVRYQGAGHTLPSAPVNLTFTGETDDFTYISTDEVQLVSASGGAYYSNRKGEYALDGNPFTTWHSAANAPMEITVKFTQAKQFSGFAYLSSGRNGRVSSVDVQVSLDGQHWIHAGSASGWGHNSNRKELRLLESIPARYVKLVASQTHGNKPVEANRYIAANTLDFYEDTTRVATDATQICYSSTFPTRDSVKAFLMLGAGCTIGEGQETEFTFTENGIHNFYFTNAQGKPDSVIAKVTWIDRDAPTAEVTYSPTGITDGPVIATVIPSEQVSMLNTLQGVHSYEFKENGSFTFQMVDMAGNTASVTATVTWIRPTSGNVASFSFTGDNAGKIILDEFYTPWEVTAAYTLGSRAAVTVNLAAGASKSMTLSPEEVQYLADLSDSDAEITVTVSIPGQEGVQSCTIDLSPGAAPVMITGSSHSAAKQIAIHDGENWIIGKTAHLEYSQDQGQTWMPYVHGQTRFPGDQTVKVRYGAHDLTRPGGSIELTFTELGDSADFSYIPITRVSLVKDGNGQYWNSNVGAYALDANPFTFWHSANAASREYIVKFDREIDLAGFTYHVEDTSKSGRFQSVDVYVSLDGQTWEKAGGAAGWTWTNANTTRNEPKTLALDRPAKALYVKLYAENTSTNHVVARDFDFYEDATPKPPVADVGDQEYSDLKEAFTAAGSNGEVVLKGQDGDIVREAITALAGLTGVAAPPRLTIPAGDSDASVTFDQAAAQAVQGKATGSGQIRLVVANITGQQEAVQGAAATYRITLTQDDASLYPASTADANGTATVTVPLPAGITRPAVYHVDTAGGKTALRFTVQGNTIRFTTSHFSLFTIEESGELEKEVIAFAGKTLLFKDSIRIKYRLTTDAARELTADQLTLQMWTAADYAAMNLNGAQPDKTATPTKTFTEIIRNGSTKDGDPYWEVTTDGIPAKDMGTLEYVRACAEIEGQIFYTDVLAYSPARYAQDCYERSTNPDMVQLAIALANYGAAAEGKLSGIPEEQRMNQFLKEEDRADIFNESMLTELSTCDSAKLPNADTVSFTEHKKTVIYRSALALKYSYAETDIYQNAQEAKLLYWSAEDYEKYDVLSKDNCTGFSELKKNGNTFEGELTGIAAKDLGKTCYLSYYVKDAGGAEHYSELTAYSAHFYIADRSVNSTDAGTRTLVKALAVYSHMAKTYCLKYN